MLLSMDYSGCGVQVDLPLHAASGLLTLAFCVCADTGGPTRPLHLSHLNDADLDAGATLLQLFSTAAAVEPPPPKASKSRNNVVSVQARDEPGAAPVMNPPDSGEGWAWEPSCHVGLLTYHDGRKRWYHCTQCKYFNDRLYHSKMHYQRIHVNQGKSMPRKRKYMEPAGSVAGEASALPPQHVQQPEPKYSRVRQPGDKWLKTVAPGKGQDASSSGFRYQSIKDRLKSEDDSTNSYSEEAQAASEDAPSTPSEDYMPSAAERERTERELQLSATEKQLYCWEPKDAIQRGVDKGSTPRKFYPVYSFQDATAAPSAVAAKPAATQGACSTGSAAALSVVTNLPEVGSTAGRGEGIAALAARSKNVTWWWHNPRDKDSVDAGVITPASSHSTLAATPGVSSAKQGIFQAGSGTQQATPVRGSETASHHPRKGSAPKHLEDDITALSMIMAESATSSQDTIMTPQNEGDLASSILLALANGGTKESPAASAPRGRGTAKEPTSDDSGALASVLVDLPRFDGKGKKTAAVKDMLTKAAAKSDTRGAAESAKAGDDTAAAVGRRKSAGAATAARGGGAGVAGGEGAAARRGSPQAARAPFAQGKKRVWKRWDPAEEAELERAVAIHGTKDWMAIVEVGAVMCAVDCPCVCVRAVTRRAAGRHGQLSVSALSGNRMGVRNDIVFGAGDEYGAVSEAAAGPLERHQK